MIHREATGSSSRVAVIVIGRDEAPRLARALESARGVPVVYVDSGSSDDSVELARAAGCQVVELDATRPFGAARARNAGLRSLGPEVHFAQLLDGDSALEPPWLAWAIEELARSPRVAVLFGQVSERRRDVSPLRRLLHLEWRRAPGDASMCGGIALVRVEALRSVGGFDESLTGGEEPELCVRLRRRGWVVRCVDRPMATHDAAAAGARVWWRRAVRSGAAYAEAAVRHGRGAERFRLRELASLAFWGAGLPAVAVSCALPSLGASLGLLGAYPLLGCRIYRRQRRTGSPRGDAWLYAASCVGAKVPGAIGAARVILRRGIQPSEGVT